MIGYGSLWGYRRATIETELDFSTEDSVRMSAQAGLEWAELEPLETFTQDEVQAGAEVGLDWMEIVTVEGSAQDEVQAGAEVSTEWEVVE